MFLQLFAALKWRGQLVDDSRFLRRKLIGMLRINRWEVCILQSIVYSVDGNTFF